MLSSPFDNAVAAKDGGDDIIKLKVMLVKIRWSQDDGGGDAVGEVVKTKKARKS